jgi:hypothetical protein
MSESTFPKMPRAGQLLWGKKQLSKELVGSTVQPTGQIPIGSGAQTC